MKPCNRRRDEIADHAAGGDASASLAAHLEACPACAAAASAWRARMQKIDDGLRQWGTGEPSTGSIARILAGVREEAARRRWFPEWKPVAAGILALAMLALSVAYARRAAVQREEARRALYTAATIANWKSPTRGLLRGSSNSWSKELPRLGEGYFNWKRGVRTKEAEDP